MHIISSLFDAWKESIVLLLDMKSAKKLITLSFSKISYRLILLCMAIIGIMFVANAQANSFALQIVFASLTFILLICTVIDLRSSKFIKNGSYYLDKTPRALLLILVLCSLLGFILPLPNNQFVFMIYIFLVSPLLIFYILFLYDTNLTISSHLKSLRNALVLCIRNAPLILAIYIVFGILIALLYYTFFNLIPSGFSSKIFYYVLIIFLVLYWALMVSLYIKRRFDEIDYYVQ